MTSQEADAWLAGCLPTPTDTSQEPQMVRYVSWLPSNPLPFRVERPDPDRSVRFAHIPRKRQLPVFPAPSRTPGNTDTLPNLNTSDFESAADPLIRLEDLFNDTTASHEDASINSSASRKRRKTDQIPTARRHQTSTASWLLNPPESTQSRSDTADIDERPSNIDVPVHYADLHHAGQDLQPFDLSLRSLEPLGLPAQTDVPQLAGLTGVEQLRQSSRVRDEGGEVDMLATDSSDFENQPRSVAMQGASKQRQRRKPIRPHTEVKQTDRQPRTSGSRHKSSYVYQELIPSARVPGCRSLEFGYMVPTPASATASPESMRRTTRVAPRTVRSPVGRALKPYAGVNVRFAPVETPKVAVGPESARKPLSKLNSNSFTNAIATMSVREPHESPQLKRGTKTSTFMPLKRSVSKHKAVLLPGHRPLALVPAPVTPVKHRVKAVAVQRRKTVIVSLDRKKPADCARRTKLVEKNVKAATVVKQSNRYGLILTRAPMAQEAAGGSGPAVGSLTAPDGLPQEAEGIEVGIEDVPRLIDTVPVNEDVVMAVAAPQASKPVRRLSMLSSSQRSAQRRQSVRNSKVLRPVRDTIDPTAFRFPPMDSQIPSFARSPPPATITLAQASTAFTLAGPSTHYTTDVEQSGNDDVARMKNRSLHADNPYATTPPQMMEDQYFSRTQLAQVADAVMPASPVPSQSTPSAPPARQPFLACSPEMQQPVTPQRQLPLRGYLGTLHSAVASARVHSDIEHMGDALMEEDPDFLRSQTEWAMAEAQDEQSIRQM